MSRPRKHDTGLPLRMEARVWKDGKTVTYRYLSPNGEKVYLGTDLEHALAAYQVVAHRHPNGQVSRRVSASLEQQKEAARRPDARLVRFYARAALNVDDSPGIPTEPRIVPTEAPTSGAVRR